MLARFLQHVPAGGGVVLPHRVPDEGVVSQQAREIGMAAEDDAVEVPGFTFEPIGPLEDGDESVEGSVLLGQGGLESHVVMRRDRVEVEDHLVSVVSIRDVEEIDAAQIEEEAEVQVGVIAEEDGRLLPGPKA